MTLRHMRNALCSNVFLITCFGNKLGTNATHLLNLDFNISESRFEGYPARRHDFILDQTLDLLNIDRQQDSNCIPTIAKPTTVAWCNVFLSLSVVTCVIYLLFKRGCVHVTAECLLFCFNVMLASIVKGS